MNITVTGGGYVGLVTGVCLAALGNDVIYMVLTKVKENINDEITAHLL